MTDSKNRNAAALIWNCWQNGTVMDNLPENLRPATRAEGYAIQAQITTLSDASIFGWKIAATSTAGQEHIGVSGPLAGRLLEDRVFKPGQILTFGANRMAVAEPEFAFRMGSQFEPRTKPYSQAEVMDAVETLHTAIEVPDSRFANFAQVGEAVLIADNACAHEFVIGPPMPEDWRNTDLVAHPVEISVIGGATHFGIGENVLEDPRVALSWLVNELRQNGITLERGMTVTTGTCATPIPIQAGDKVRADYGSLGSLEITFASS